ncbi:hypothetical protein ACRRTK_018259 [Alexandromys fortis]
MCMLLLVSSLLLWEHAASKATGVVSTEDLYDRVVEQSHVTYNLAADIYYEFTEDLLKAIINITNAWEEPLKHLVSAVPSLPKPSDDMLKTVNAVKAKSLVLLEGLKTILNRDKKLAKGRLFRDSRNNTCHTTSISASKKTEDLLKVIINVSSTWKYPLKLLPPATLTHLGSYDGMLARAIEVNFGNQEVLKGAKILLSRSEDLLKVSIRILQDWKDPVKHMAIIVARLPDASDVMISRTKELEERILGLLEGLKIILSRIQPGTVETENSFWYGWSDLESSDEDTRNIALYTLGRCVRRDTHKVDNFLKVLKCRDVHNNNC